MCTLPSVLMGPSLTSFIASNYALIQPTLVTIPGGTFTMGAGTNCGAHQATISTFQMGRTPVTNGQYARYLTALGSKRHALIGEVPGTEKLWVIALGPDKDELRSTVRSVAHRSQEILLKGGLDIFSDVTQMFLLSLKDLDIGDNNPPAGFDGPGQPVINVDWFKAAVYAFLHGVMLPTEWQWEYAARVVAGKGLRTYATPSGRLTHEEAHYGSKSTVDVDDPRYPTLENGLRHMTGNVKEWMQNWYGPYPNEEVVDPTGPLGIHYRGLRGGSWFHTSPTSLRANIRNHHAPHVKGVYTGFRVAAPAEPTIR